VHQLAFLTGTTSGRPFLPISQPTLPDVEAYTAGVREIFASHQITNERRVRDLEAKAAGYLGCREVVALANATSGLVLLARLLGMKGDVCLPSFTFPATLHALLWNNLKPRLIYCDPETFNISPESLEAGLASGARGAVPVYIFGNSPDWERLQPILARHGASCYSDAAHGLGTRWDGVMAGNFGDAEVFSLAPTKVTVAGEGGLVATNNPELAGALRIARNYGNPGDYDCVVAGLNARMTELHAWLATLSLDGTEAAIDRRHQLVARYRAGLEGVPGIGFQKMDRRCRTTYNYVAVLLEPGAFGLSNRQVKKILEAEGIQCRIYFAPPLHRQSRFTHLFEGQGPFPGTDAVLERVLCLPLYTHMSDDSVDYVVEVLRACHSQAERLASVLD